MSAGDGLFHQTARGEVEVAGPDGCLSGESRRSRSWAPRSTWEFHDVSLRVAGRVLRPVPLRGRLPRGRPRRLHRVVGEVGYFNRHD